MSYTDFLEMYARDVKKDPETLLAQKPLSFPVSTNQRGDALVDFFQRTTTLELKGKRVLDVGCAYGGLSIALANAGANVSAIDVNPKFISYAQANVKGSADVDLRAVDASSIGVRKAFERGSFDLVVLNDVLEHIYDTTSLVSNLDYLLSEQGLVYFKVPNGSSPRFILSEGHRKIFGLSLLDPDCWFHLYPKRASIFYRPLGFFKAIFAYHGFPDISFVNEENVFPRFPIKKLRKQVRDIALHAREFEYPDKTVRVYLRHAIARFREEFEYDVEHQSEDHVRFKYGSYFFTGFAGRPQSGLKARSPVRHVLGMGAIIDPHGERAPRSGDATATDDGGDDAAEPPPSAEFCTNCGSRLALGMPCPACGGPGPGTTDGEELTVGAEESADATEAESGRALGESSASKAVRAPDAVAASTDTATRVFRPSFDVRELRRCIAQHSLRPYERLERDSVSRGDLQRLAEQGWQKAGSRLISLSPPIDWSVEDRGVKHRLHAWEPLSTLLAGSEKFGESRWFAAAFAAVMDWLRQFQSFAEKSRTYAELDQALGQREDLVWYDMGVGFRCYRLAYVLDVAARDPAYSDDDIELLTQALYFHNEALSRASFFRSHNNHGVYQALGQLACARRFPWLPKMADYARLSEERLVRLCREHFFESGVHREHSPGYQYMVLNSLIGAKNAGLLDDPECVATLARAQCALMWMIQPDGRICPIGDTDPRSVRLNSPADLIYDDAHLCHVISGGKVGTPPPAAVQAYHEAGYVFARLPSVAGQAPEEWSYLSQIAGFHSRIHKHADHLSFTWFERGQDVLVDAGRYGYLGRTEPRSALAKEGYWYSNPKRMFVESTRAHNTVEIDGRDLPRVGAQPFGTAIVHAGQQQEVAVTHCRATYFDSIEHERVLVLCPGRFLLVIDALTDAAEGAHAFTQRFNFAPHWDVAAQTEGFVARSARGASEVLQVRSMTARSTASNVVRGQHEPQLLGWYSDAENSLVPVSSVAFSQNETARSLFVTLFAFGAEVAFNELSPALERLADIGELSFVIDGLPTSVRLKHEASGLILVEARGASTHASSAGGTLRALLSASVSDEPLEKKPAPSARRLCITVDVEARPDFANGRHVDKLIWGRFPEGTCGIDELMTAADRYGAKLTMFLDYSEQQLYGEALLDVGREIHRRGHDLQLLLNPQCFSDAFYGRHGVAPLHDLNLVSSEEAKIFADFLSEQHEKVTGSAASAFRGSGSRFNAPLLKELKKRGVRLDSSYDCVNESRLVDLGPRKQFAWDCGVFELPVSAVFDFLKTKRRFAYDFNAAMLEPSRTIDAVVRHFKLLDRFYTELGEDAVAVMVMHSWSLLRPGTSGLFEYEGRAALERFEALLEALNGAVDFVTSDDVGKMLASDRLARGPSCALPAGRPREPTPSLISNRALATGPVAIPSSTGKSVVRSQRLPRVEVAMVRSPGAEVDTLRLRVETCPLCGDALEVLDKDQNCRGCGSRARLRALHSVIAECAEEFRRTVPALPVLAFAMTDDERQVLRPAFDRFKSVSLFGRYCADHEEGIDARDLSRYVDGSYAGHYGSLIFDYFEEHEQALAEAFRVLAPGGVLLTHIAPYRLTDDWAPARVATQIAARPGYFDYLPKDVSLPSVKVGRSWFVAALRRAGFTVRLAQVTDAASGIVVDWFVGVKPGAAVEEGDVAARASPRAGSAGGLAGSTSDSAVVRALSPIDLSVDGCPVCGDRLVSLEHEQNCPKCGSRARLRALKPVLVRFAEQLELGPLHLPLLGFAMSGGERDLLRTVYRQLKSVSLFGSYGKDHELGVDARDLSRYADGSFSCHFGCLLFDYFHEHEQALAEAYRVVAPGGALLTLIAGYRLVDGMTPPHVTGQIQKREGYFEYLKDGDVLVNIEVGRDWFANELRRVGFEAHLCRVTDVASGLVLEWFVGLKPLVTDDSLAKATEPTARRVSSSAMPRPRTAELSEARTHTYSTPLDPETGFKRVVVRVSVPALPAVASGCEFSHHEFITDDGVGGDRVFALQRGGVLLSEDMGQHWEYVATPATRDVRLWNAFTSRAGNILLQGLTSGDVSSMAGPPLFVCDASLNVVDELQLGREPWHGTRSIDESRGTIIYAEYPKNSVKYRADFEQRHVELLPHCRDAAVFRSTDGGRSWAKVFEKSWQEIRHFHTVAADPHEAGVWFLSSGDKPRECRVWRSHDDGLSWQDISADGSSVDLHPAMKGQHQAVNRYTDIVVLPDRLLWGSDDLLGNLSQFSDPNATLANRVGARVFSSSKSVPLQPRCVGFVGNHVRSMIDVGPGYLLLTEAKGFASGSRPQVCLLLKAEPHRLLELFTVDRHLARGTGFSYSRASRAAKNGRFFSYRDAYDVFAGGPRILQWDIEFE